MKKKLAFLLAATLLLGTAGCGAKETPAAEPAAPQRLRKRLRQRK